MRAIIYTSNLENFWSFLWPMLTKSMCSANALLKLMAFFKIAIDQNGLWPLKPMTTKNLATKIVPRWPRIFTVQQLTHEVDNRVIVQLGLRHMLHSGTYTFSMFCISTWLPKNYYIFTFWYKNSLFQSGKSLVFCWPSIWPQTKIYPHFFKL